MNGVLNNLIALAVPAVLANIPHALPLVLMLAEPASDISLSEEEPIKKPPVPEVESDQFPNPLLLSLEPLPQVL